MNEPQAQASNTVRLGPLGHAALRRSGDRVGQRISPYSLRNPIVTPSRPRRNPIETPSRHHASNWLATRSQLATITLASGLRRLRRTVGPARSEELNCSPSRPLRLPPIDIHFAPLRFLRRLAQRPPRYYANHRSCAEQCGLAGSYGLRSNSADTRPYCRTTSRLQSPGGALLHKRVGRHPPP